MSCALAPPIPITILTGFLGAGKTTILLNLIPQLPSPPETRLCVLKNEFGLVAVDSRLVSSSSSFSSNTVTPPPNALGTPGVPGVETTGAAAGTPTTSGSPVSGVLELLNGCICCNLVGQLGEALEHLSKTYNPTRIVIETSGSAFPATLAMEINRLSNIAATSNLEGAVGPPAPRYFLDGTILVVDVENFPGYSDKSPTAKLQAAFTDLVILSKWEECPGGERQVEDVVDQVRGVCEDVPVVKSRRGWVDREVLLGVDKGQRRLLDVHEHIVAEEAKACGSGCVGLEESHTSEVDVLSVRLSPSSTTGSPAEYLDYSSLQKLLASAPKDEIYRMKALFRLSHTPPPPPSPLGGATAPTQAIKSEDQEGWFILNWAFGRWTVTRVEHQRLEGEGICNLTAVLARGEGLRWKKRIEVGNWVVREGAKAGAEGLSVEIVV